jgi:hypothetical protein
LQFLASGRISNVSISAISPADHSISGNIRLSDPVIQGSEKVLRVSGLRMIGNCNISSAVNTGSFSSVRYRNPGGNYTNSSYQYTGWAVAAFGAVYGQSTALAIWFGVEGAQTGWNGSLSTADYNQNWNNLHLLNNSLAVASSTGSPSGAGWTTIGPAVGSILGEVTQTETYPERNWTDWRVKPGGYPGISGRFGLFNTVNAGIQRTVGALRPFTLRPFGNSAAFMTIIRVAGSGAIPSVSYTGVTPGGVGAYVNFDALNMQVRAYRQGVDVNSSHVHEINFVL